MSLTKQQLAVSFSKGNFEKVFPYLSENINWETIQQFKMKGKKAVIEKCKNTAEYFNKVNTDFKLLNTLRDGNTVVVTGTAEFLDNGKRLEFVSACDIYDFDENNQIEKITSYCVVE